MKHGGTETGSHKFTFETIILENTDAEDSKESDAIAALYEAAEKFDEAQDMARVVAKRTYPRHVLGFIELFGSFI
jgi:hypothetical protein